MSINANKKNKNMKKFKMKTYAGSDFDSVALEAKAVSMRKSCIVEFEFNGVVCLVHDKTNLQWLLRDYMNSWIMGWKQVGADCVKKYSPEVQKELKEKTAAQEEKQRLQEAARILKEAEEKAIFNKKVNGIEIELKDKKSWKEFVDKNKDPYGSACVEYADSWARLMQAEFAKGKKIADCAKETSYQLGFLGITGFMYGCAVSMLAKCWKHGEALRMWHNLDTQIKDEGERANEDGGVLNPALLSITT